jgi:hypothetical protein
VKKIISLLSVVIFCLSCSETRLKTEKEISGAWKFYTPNSLDTFEVDNPVSFAKVWYENQIIDDLLYNNNISAVFIDYERTWILEKQFTVTDTELQSKSVLLNLKGLDGALTVVLNDFELGDW